MGAQLQSPGGFSGSRRRKTHRAMSEINVTPFVDVMLVLLIVFMVTAPLLTVGVPVDLPRTKARAMSEQDSTPLEITVSREGKVLIGETSVTTERLKAMLAAIAENGVDRRIYIRADQSLAYGTVMEVMAAVNLAGFNKVALISDPRGG